MWSSASSTLVMDGWYAAANPILFTQNIDGVRGHTSILRIGQGYTGMPALLDSSYFYVFFKSTDQFHIYLARVTPASFFTPSAYQFVTAIDASNNPTWGSVTNKLAIFTDVNGLGIADGPVNVSYNAPLNRFFLVEYVNRNTLGIFDAPTPWGPWTTVTYIVNFIDTEIKLEPNFPTKFISSDGMTMWMLFSGHNVYDSANFVPITLISNAPPGPMAPAAPTGVQVK